MSNSTSAALIGHYAISHLNTFSLPRIILSPIFSDPFNVWIFTPFKHLHLLSYTLSILPFLSVSSFRKPLWLIKSWIVALPSVRLEQTIHSPVPELDMSFCLWVSPYGCCMILPSSLPFSRVSHGAWHLGNNKYWWNELMDKEMNISVLGVPALCVVPGYGKRST